MVRKKIEFKINPITGCHECISHAISSNGYPICKYKGKQINICRYLYIISHKDKDITDKVIRHTCDNKLCINPDHLIIGTHADNVADRVLRHRSATGEKNGRSKITEKDVLFIREHKEISSHMLSKIYGIDGKTVRDIRIRKIWKHV